MRRLSERAVQKGLECNRRARERQCTPRATAHDQGQPRKFHGRPAGVWRNVTPKNGNVSRDGEDTIGFKKETSSIRAPRESMLKKLVNGLATLTCGLEMFAKLVSLSRPRRRSTSTSTHSKTSPSSLTTLWTLWVRSSDTFFVTLAIPTQSLLQLLVLLAMKNGREQNHRHLAHHASSHHAFGLSARQSMGCQVCW